MTRPLSPATTILPFAFAAGAATLVLGFIGALLWWPHSNDAPLFAFLVLAPLGFLAGAAYGLVRRRPGILWRIAGMLFTASYAWCLLRLSPRFGVFAAAAFAMMAIATFAAARELPRNRRAALLACAALLAISALFVPVEQHALAPTSKVPPVLFVLDARLDATHAVPQVRINTLILLLEWLALGKAAAVLMAKRTRAA